LIASMAACVESACGKMAWEALDRPLKLGERKL
jgi:hypothetical protein